MELRQLDHGNRPPIANYCGDGGPSEPMPGGLADDSLQDLYEQDLMNILPDVVSTVNHETLQFSPDEEAAVFSDVIGGIRGLEELSGRGGVSNPTGCGDAGTDETIDDAAQVKLTGGCDLKQTKKLFAESDSCESTREAEPVVTDDSNSGSEQSDTESCSGIVPIQCRQINEAAAVELPKATSSKHRQPITFPCKTPGKLKPRKFSPKPVLPIAMRPVEGGVVQQMKPQRSVVTRRRVKSRKIRDILFGIDKSDSKLIPKSPLGSLIATSVVSGTTPLIRKIPCSNSQLNPAEVQLTPCKIRGVAAGVSLQSLAISTREQSSSDSIVQGIFSQPGTCVLPAGMVCRNKPIAQTSDSSVTSNLLGFGNPGKSDVLSGGPETENVVTFVNSFTSTSVSPSQSTVKSNQTQSQILGGNESTGTVRCAQMVNAKQIMNLPAFSSTVQVSSAGVTQPIANSQGNPIIHCDPKQSVTLSGQAITDSKANEMSLKFFRISDGCDGKSLVNTQGVQDVLSRQTAICAAAPKLSSEMVQGGLEAPTLVSPIANNPRMQSINIYNHQIPKLCGMQALTSQIQGFSTLQQLNLPDWQTPHNVLRGKLLQSSPNVYNLHNRHNCQSLPPSHNFHTLHNMHLSESNRPHGVFMENLSLGNGNVVALLNSSNVSASLAPSILASFGNVGCNNLATNVCLIADGSLGTVGGSISTGTYASGTMDPTASARFVSPTLVRCALPLNSGTAAYAQRVHDGQQVLLRQGQPRPGPALLPQQIHSLSSPFNISAPQPCKVLIAPQHTRGHSSSSSQLQQQILTSPSVLPSSKPHRTISQKLPSASRSSTSSKIVASALQSSAPTSIPDSLHCLTSPLPCLNSQLSSCENRPSFSNSISSTTRHLPEPEACSVETSAADSCTSLVAGADHDTSKNFSLSQTSLSVCTSVSESDETTAEISDREVYSITSTLANNDYEPSAKSSSCVVVTSADSRTSHDPEMSAQISSTSSPRSVMHICPSPKVTSSQTRESPKPSRQMFFGSSPEPEVSSTKDEWPELDSETSLSPVSLDVELDRTGLLHPGQDSVKSTPPSAMQSEPTNNVTGNSGVSSIKNEGSDSLGLSNCNIEQTSTRLHHKSPVQSLEIVLENIQTPSSIKCIELETKIKPVKKLESRRKPSGGSTWKRVVFDRLRKGNGGNAVNATQSILGSGALPLEKTSSSSGKSNVTNSVTCRSACGDVALREAKSVEIPNPSEYSAIAADAITNAVSNPKRKKKPSVHVMMRSDKRKKKRKKSILARPLLDDTLKDSEAVNLILAHQTPNGQSKESLGGPLVSMGKCECDAASLNDMVTKVEGFTTEAFTEASRKNLRVLMFGDTGVSDRFGAHETHFTRDFDGKLMDTVRALPVIDNARRDLGLPKPLLKPKQAVRIKLKVKEMKSKQMKATGPPLFGVDLEEVTQGIDTMHIGCHQMVSDVRNRNKIPDIFRCDINVHKNEEDMIQKRERQKLRAELELREDDLTGSESDITDLPRDEGDNGRTSKDLYCKKLAERIDEPKFGDTERFGQHLPLKKRHKLFTETLHREASAGRAANTSVQSAKQKPKKTSQTLNIVGNVNRVGRPKKYSYSPQVGLEDPRKRKTSSKKSRPNFSTCSQLISGCRDGSGLTRKADDSRCGYCSELCICQGVSKDSDRSTGDEYEKEDHDSCNSSDPRKKRNFIRDRKWKGIRRSTNDINGAIEHGLPKIESKMIEIDYQTILGQLESEKRSFNLKEKKSSATACLAQKKDVRNGSKTSNSERGRHVADYSLPVFMEDAEAKNGSDSTKLRVEIPSLARSSRERTIRQDHPPPPKRTKRSSQLPRSDHDELYREPRRKRRKKQSQYSPS